VSGATNGDSGKGLVDVHAIELLSIGVEPNHLLATQKGRNGLNTIAPFYLHTA
jgi:hypothetical protein